MNDRRLAQGRQRERILALTPANGPLFSTFAGMAYLASEIVHFGKQALTLETLEKEITALLVEDRGVQTLRGKSYTRQPGARKGSGTGGPGGAVDPRRSSFGILAPRPAMPWLPGRRPRGSRAITRLLPLLPPARGGRKPDLPGPSSKR